MMITIIQSNNHYDCMSCVENSALALSAVCCHPHGSCANIGFGTKREVVNGKLESDYCVAIG